MKIRTVVDISESVEVDVVVDIDDITRALEECISEAEKRPGSKYPVHLFLGRLHACLTALTDDMIDCLSPETRGMVVDQFGKGLERFHPKGK